jgi:hypothetical protein
MEHIGADFGCSKCTVFRAVHWVETTLAADHRFQLRDKPSRIDQKTLQSF